MGAYETVETERWQLVSSRSRRIRQLIPKEARSSGEPHGEFPAEKISTIEPLIAPEPCFHFGHEPLAYNKSRA
jgi:hypothetical protein